MLHDQYFTFYHAVALHCMLNYQYFTFFTLLHFTVCYIFNTSLFVMLFTWLYVTLSILHVLSCCCTLLYVTLSIIHVFSCCCTSLYITLSILLILSCCCTSLYVTLSILHVLSCCCTSLYVTLAILHLSYAFHRSAKHPLLPTVSCSLGCRRKISVAISYSFSLHVFLKRLLQWNLWRMASKRRQQSASNRFTWVKNVLNMLGYKMKEHFGVCNTPDLEAVL